MILLYEGDGGYYEPGYFKPKPYMFDAEAQEFDKKVRSYWLDRTDGLFVDAWSAYVAGWRGCTTCWRRRRYVS